MDTYMANFDQYEKKVVYKFNIGDGGIADCIKFFMHTLNICMHHKYKLYYLVNNTKLEQYLRLHYDKMYINKDTIGENVSIVRAVRAFPSITADKYYVVSPNVFYTSFNYRVIKTKICDVFKFSQDVLANVPSILPDFPMSSSKYTSLHLRMGDKFLETPQKYVRVKKDTRSFSSDKIHQVIEQHKDTPLLFFCDNNEYKSNIKRTYPHVIITQGRVGHTSLSNTTQDQVLHAVTEFYLMTESAKIYYASKSGFPMVAAKFNYIPLAKL